MSFAILGIAVLVASTMVSHRYILPGEPKKIPPTTFVDITAMHR